MSWYRATARPHDRPAPAAAPARSGLPASLRASVGRRVTLLWRCGPAVATTTGWIVRAEGGVVEVRGAVRALAEAIGRTFRRGPSLVELSTVIPEPSICALIKDVPRGVRVAVPLFVPGPRPAPTATSDEVAGARRGGVVDPPAARARGRAASA